MALFHPSTQRFDNLGGHLDLDHHWPWSAWHSYGAQPKFDIRETEDAYELSGELPGMKKDDISITFKEPHTLQIDGRFQQTFTSGNTDQQQPPAPESSDDKSSASKFAENAATENRNAGAKKLKYWLRERRTGEFSRVFNLPANLDKHHLSATVDDGVLNIIVPKSKGFKTQKISIS
ncbi:hypothetical protein LMH87_007428 [Akanthomyces muscarius]|uniref:SHSP domain-containing protein n=1 Tax=Akanthomyces muscarius TaxID=2231603 RepID=A0A9W8QPN3_AKAMU|nr:hypothetical protein LMH87_007428 [Akanthomyces muscarius]KAJ4165813.1 hypothetical protein LMH87_007428 [Akanthomyces muscarius]